jgi:hypothetical protein
MKVKVIIGWLLSDYFFVPIGLLFQLAATGFSLLDNTKAESVMLLLALIAWIFAYMYKGEKKI